MDTVCIIFYELFRDISEYEGRGGLLAIDFMIGLVFLALTSYVIYLFFTKNKNFPKYYIILLIGTILFNITIFCLMGADSENNDIKDVFKSILVAMIWMPYIIKSKRVRATFIK